MKKTTSILLFSLIVIIILGMPHNHISVIKRINEVDKIIKQVELDDKNSMTLYLNQSGLLRCAITSNNLFFYRLKRISEGIKIKKSHETEAGNLRCWLNILWYDKDKKYVIFGYISDKDVATITYQQKKLTEVLYNNIRIVYGFGNSDNEQCSDVVKIYDYEGTILDKIKK